MKTNVVELLVGAATLVVAVLFVVYAYSSAGSRDVGSGYAVTASFDRVDGLNVGADVRVAGVRVGAVEAISLDPDTLFANTRIRLSDSLRLPADSSARITSAGLFSDNYVSLEPGGEEEKLADGGEILYTRGSIDLISLISRAVFAAGGNEGGGQQEGGQEGGGQEGQGAGQ